MEYSVRLQCASAMCDHLAMRKKSRSRRTTSFSVVAALLALALVGLLFAVLVWGAWEALSVLTVEVSATLVTAFATVFAATVAVVLGRYFERKREIENKQREKWAAVYDEFIAEFLGTMELDKKKDERGAPDEGALIKFIAKFSSKFMSWGPQGCSRLGWGFGRPEKRITLIAPFGKECQ